VSGFENINNMIKQLENDNILMADKIQNQVPKSKIKAGNQANTNVRLRAHLKN